MISVVAGGRPQRCATGAAWAAVTRSRLARCPCVCPLARDWPGFHTESQQDAGEANLHVRGRTKHWIIIGATTLATLLLIGVPILIKESAPKGTTWQDLSDASQIYTSTFAGLALIGVAASLIHQAKQSRVAAHELARANQRELFTLTLEDPTLAACYGPEAEQLTELRFKQIGFTNLLLAAMYSAYMLDLYSDADLALELEHHFCGEVARHHWRLRGSHWTAEAENSEERGHRNFVRIVHDAYGKAVQSGPPVSPAHYFHE